VSECKHKWIANSGQGGEPIFRGQLAVVHVKCEKCNARTWMDQSAWDKARKTK